MDKDKTRTLRIIQRLEGSMDKDIQKAFSEMNFASDSELADITRRYAIGEKYQEYTNRIILLHKDYFDIILEQMMRYELERNLSREKSIELMGYLMGPKYKEI